jgi:phosphoglucomutase
MYLEEYRKWIDSSFIDEDTKRELKNIESDEKEIEDRFYKNLEFGTAGLRGVIGAGTNRMNKYTVSKATQGLANFIIKENGKDNII